MKETLNDRSILEVLRVISFDREIATYEKNVDVETQKENEFQRLMKPARKLGYSVNEIYKSDIRGRICACIEAGDTELEKFYRNCLRDIK